MSSPASPYLIKSRVLPKITANSDGLTTSSWPLIPCRMCVLYVSCQDTKFIPFSGSQGRFLFQQIFYKFSYFLKFFREVWPSLLPFQCTQPPQWSSLSSFSAAPSKFILSSQMGILLTYKSSMISSSDSSRLVYFIFFKQRLVPS